MRLYQWLVPLAFVATTLSLSITVCTKTNHEFMGTVQPREHCREIRTSTGADWAKFVKLVRERFNIPPQSKLHILDAEGYVIQDFDAIEPDEKVYAYNPPRIAKPNGGFEYEKPPLRPPLGATSPPSPPGRSADTTGSADAHKHKKLRRRRAENLARPGTPENPSRPEMLSNANLHPPNVSYGMDEAHGPHARKLDEIRRNMTKQSKPTVFLPFQMPVAKVHIGDILAKGNSWAVLNNHIRALVLGHYKRFTESNLWLKDVRAETRNDAFYRLQMTSESKQWGANWKLMYGTDKNFLKLVAAVQHVADLFLTHLKLDSVRSSRERAVSAAWASVHHNGSEHSSHVHPNNLLSVVYYCALPKGSESTPITFSASHVGAGVAEFEVQVEEGTMLVFPAWMPHRVARVESTSQRCSVSLNLPGNWDAVNELHSATEFSIRRMEDSHKGRHAKLREWEEKGEL